MDVYMIAFISGIVGLIIGFIKDRPLVGFLLGYLLSIFGLLLIVIIPSKTPVGTCFQCGTNVDTSDISCPICNTHF